MVHCEAFTPRSLPAAFMERNCPFRGGHYTPLPSYKRPSPTPEHGVMPERLRKAPSFSGAVTKPRC